jgi:hypothetical protein
MPTWRPSVAHCGGPFAAEVAIATEYRSPSTRQAQKAELTGPFLNANPGVQRPPGRALCPLSIFWRRSQEPLRNESGARPGTGSMKQSSIVACVRSEIIRRSVLLSLVVDPVGAVPSSLSHEDCSVWCPSSPGLKLVSWAGTGIALDDSGNRWEWAVGLS